MKLDGIRFVTIQDRPIDYFSLDGDGSQFISDLDVAEYNQFAGFMKIIGISYDEKTDENVEVEVGEIDFHAYNLKNLNFDCFEAEFAKADKNSSLYVAMDMESSDTALYYAVFAQSYDRVVRLIHPEVWDEISMHEGDTYLITLDRCKIYEEYRKQGIGKFIHKNFFKIFYTYYNIVSLFMVGICVPDEGESENMRDVQMKLLEDNDFLVFNCCNEISFCKCIYDSKFLDAIW